MLKFLSQSGSGGYKNDEVQLLEGLKNNREDAFDFLYSEYYPVVSRFILTRGGQEEDAKDIFQETVLSTWQNLKSGKYKPNGHFKTYFIQISKYKWYDQLKSGSRQKTDYTDQFPEFSEFDQEDEEVLKNSQIEELLDYYNRIDDNCKKLLKLFYFDRLSLKEIGRIMGLEPDSAKNQKYRCINKIKHLIKK